MNGSSVIELRDVMDKIEQQYGAPRGASAQLVAHDEITLPPKTDKINIYTTYFYNVPNLSEEQKNMCYSIASKLPKSNPGMKSLECFSGKYEWIIALKEGTITEGDVTSRYRRKLSRYANGKFFSNLKEGVILVNYAGPKDYCVRKVLAEYCEERMPGKFNFQELPSGRVRGSLQRQVEMNI